MSSVDFVGKVMAYEAGKMTHAEVVVFFSHLIETGLAWKMQGPYGRMARVFIERGECQPGRPGEVAGGGRSIDAD